MPIEIKELHIKINVEDKPASGETKKVRKDEKDQIIATCVEQVMEILSKNQER